MYLTKSQIMLVCFGIFLFFSQSFGQANETKKFDTVPVPIREGLIKRLKLFIEYDRTDQYEKKYDMFSEYTKTLSWKRKDDYVKFRQDVRAGVIKEKLKFNITKLISFDIKSAKDFSLDESPDFRMFHLNGIVKYQDGKKIKKKALLLEARFEKNEWYFSDWLEEITIYD